MADKNVYRLQVMGRIRAAVRHRGPKTRETGQATIEALAGVLVANFFAQHDVPFTPQMVEETSNAVLTALHASLESFERRN